MQIFRKLYRTQNYKVDLCDLMPWAVCLWKWRFTSLTCQYALRALFGKEFMFSELPQQIAHLNKLQRNPNF